MLTMIAIIVIDKFHEFQISKVFCIILWKYCSFRILFSCFSSADTLANLSPDSSFNIINMGGNQYVLTGVQCAFIFVYISQHYCTVWYMI